MFEEKTVVTKFNVLLDSGCVETTRAEILYKNGKYHSQRNFDCCYMPTELDKFANDMGEDMTAEINYLTAKWTPEFVAAYKAEIARLNPEPEQ